MSTEVLRTAWKRQNQWSDTANELKLRYGQWRQVVFGLTITAALAASLSVELQSGIFAKGLAMLAAICAGLSPLISTQKNSKDRLQAWTRARSASEELKSSIFKYLTSKNADRTNLLNEAQEAAIENVRDIVPVHMQADLPKRALLEDMTVEDYIKHRLIEQAETYYFPQAQNNDAVAKRFHLSYFILMVIAAIISAMNGIFDLQWLGNWTAVVTTLAASVLAYLAAGRYEYLSLSYQATGDQLINLRNRWEAQPTVQRNDDATTSNFVVDCETVISNQNQSWHAKLATDGNVD